jgi:hypothetical protein
LITLVSDKENKVNSFDFLWPGLAGFGQIWEDLGSALRKPYWRERRADMRRIGVPRPMRDRTPKFTPM